MSLKSEPLTVLLHFIFQRSSSSPKINVPFFSRFIPRVKKFLLFPVRKELKRHSYPVKDRPFFL
jgi:hypothetical protein